MRIGIDFDNTLIDYDHVFVVAARERGLVDAAAGASKRLVRDTIRSLPDGELSWQRLQGWVYGSGIGQARLFAGAIEFLRRCRASGVAVFIVSHKTRHGHHDPARVDLREAARGWMKAQGFFDPAAVLVPGERVFFEDTRAAKLARIAALDCTYFIDDLEEVFADPGFPPGVRRVLFGNGDRTCCEAVCASWTEIAAVVFDDAL